MRKVAEAFSLTTSTVSQQIAALAKEAGEQLIEPDGRRQPSWEPGITSLIARSASYTLLTLADLDLDPDAEPVGTVRVGGFQDPAFTSRSCPSSVRWLRPIRASRWRSASTSRWRHSSCSSMMTLDLAITYDYNLAPASPDSVLETRCAVVHSMGFGRSRPTPLRTDAPICSAFADSIWIVNSRNTADEDAVRTLAALAGFTPHIAHQIDSLDLVEDLILDGHGVGLPPVNRPLRDGLTIPRLSDPRVILTAYAVTRRGRSNWPPLRTILDRLRPQGPSLPHEDWPRPAAHQSPRDVQES